MSRLPPESRGARDRTQLRKPKKRKQAATKESWAQILGKGGRVRPLARQVSVEEPMPLAKKGSRTLISRTASQTYYCGNCEQWMEQNRKRNHLDSESHKCMASKWRYCYPCDERFRIQDWELHACSQNEDGPTVIPDHSEEKTSVCLSSWLEGYLSGEDPSPLRKKQGCRSRKSRKWRKRKVKRSCQLCHSHHKTQGEWDDHLQSEEHLSRQQSLQRKKQSRRKEAETNQKFVEFAKLPPSKKMDIIQQKINGIRGGIEGESDQKGESDTEGILGFIQANWNDWKLFSFAKAGQSAAEMEIDHICDSLASLEFTEQWQVLDDSLLFLNVSDECNVLLQTLPVRKMSEYRSSKHTYRLRKTAEDRAVQQNVKYETMRHLRLVLLDTSKPPRRIVWKSEAATKVTLGLIKAMQRMIVGCKETVDGWPLAKVDESTVAASNAGEIAIFRRFLIEPYLNTELLNNSTVDRALFLRKKGLKTKEMLGDVERQLSEAKARRVFQDGMPSAVIKSLKKLDNAENVSRLISFLVKAQQFSRVMTVFHGTDPETVPKISKNGFNRDFNTTAVFGKGTYFGSTSKISHEYSKPDASHSRFMFICRMGITHFQLGDQSIVTPPFLSDGVTQVDTLVNNIDHPTKLVAMKDDNVIPLWLVEYQLLW